MSKTVFMALRLVPAELWGVLHLLEGRKVIIYSLSLPRLQFFFSSWIVLLAFPNTRKHLKYVI